MTLIILAFRIAYKLMLLPPLLQFNRRQGSLKCKVFAAVKTSLIKHQRNIKIVKQVLNMIALSSSLAFAYRTDFNFVQSCRRLNSGNWDSTMKL